MEDGSHCPRCQNDIGLWPVFVAGWPTRIKCPHCGARLGYDFRVWRVFALLVVPLVIVLTVVSAAIAYSTFWHLGIVPSAICALVVFVGLWAMFECFIAAYLRNHKVLRPTGYRPNHRMEADAATPSESEDPDRE